jgi:myo-inositol-1(or 4)-monophosphatase
MSEQPYSEDLAAARLAAKEAGAIIMRLFKGKYDVEEKSKNNPVTTADLAANRKIHETILDRFPRDGWLSEEDKDTEHRLALRRVWVVDPIDGTKEFIEGVPQFAVSIALVVDGAPRVAVVFNPAQDLFYEAAEGHGAFLNGNPIHVTPRSEVNGALLLVSRSEPRRKFKILVDRCEIKPVGSIAFRLAQVAGGDGDGTMTFRSIREWDICAGVLMVQQAGGKVVDGSGGTLIFNQREARHHGVVAANAVLTDGLQQLWAEAITANADIRQA